MSSNGNGSPRPLEDANWVARRLGLSERSGRLRVYELSRSKTLPSVRIGRSIKFDPAAIETWIQNGGSAGGEE